MSTSVGIDLIEVGRIERAVARRPGLAERVFSPAELRFAAAKARPGRHLAARFAAKEATLKALGLGGLRLHEVEVLGGGDHKPRVTLHGKAAEVAAHRGVEVEISLTHSRELAAAVAATTLRPCASG